MKKYYVQCMTGAELKVKLGLYQLGMTRVHLPSMLVSELVKGKVKVSSRSLYPGYVIVEVEEGLDDMTVRGKIKSVSYVSKIL